MPRFRLPILSWFLFLPLSLSLPSSLTDIKLQRRMRRSLFDQLRNYPRSEDVDPGGTEGPVFPLVYSAKFELALLITEKIQKYSDSLVGSSESLSCTAECLESKPFDKYLCAPLVKTHGVDIRMYPNETGRWESVGD